MNIYIVVGVRENYMPVMLAWSYIEFSQYELLSMSEKFKCKTVTQFVLRDKIRGEN